MAPASLEGQTLGKYQMLEPLGRGGMASVYRAYHPQLDRYVAIKVLRGELVEEGEFLARFQREAKLVASLRHTNIVQAFDGDMQGDVFYMVMELLEGDTLKARLNDYRLRGEAVPPGEVVRIMLDVLDGLAYAHSEGMIHRDIKPANIMLTKRGQAVLTDFGIAQIVGGTRHTISGALMGTLNYMAPEQGMESRSDARSDLYSLGIVLYEMLTGHTPFDADTPLAVLMKHVNDPVPPPGSFGVAVPQPFERVLLKSLTKRPEDRYQTAGEMAQALRSVATEAGIELPARISLPLSFTTPAAPAESVAVFSGTTRSKLTDAQFAHGDTDAALGQRLAAEQAAVPAAAQAAPQVPPQPAPSQATTSHPAASESRLSIAGKAVLGALGIVFGGNLLLAMLAGFMRSYSIFTHGWPIELFLVGLGLCLIMQLVDSIWLLIPVGIISGNGLLMVYYQFTGNWSDWYYLWPLEPLIIGASITLSIWLAGRSDRGRWPHPIARLLALSSLTAIFVIMLVAYAWVN